MNGCLREKEEVHQFIDRRMDSAKLKMFTHRITHNGDFDSWHFNRDVDNQTLGLWLERVLHTPQRY